MTECKQSKLAFSSLCGRKVVADFGGGSISSDGGIGLIREVDRLLGLTKSASKLLADERDPLLIEHKMVTMLRQRVYGMCSGHEDMNDWDVLRHDTFHQEMTEACKPLASSPTLCRMENSQDRGVNVALNKLLVETFIKSFKQVPKRLILDFDATDNPVHGHQEGRFFHGYYDSYCFLPLYVFCGSHLLCAYLRPSNIDAAKHAAAITKLLVTRLREAFPNVEIIIRADGGFCRDLLLSWCDRHDVNYVIGISKNNVLLEFSEDLRKQAQTQFEETGKKQRLFKGFAYKAGKWKWIRWVVAKAEHSEQGANPRFVITNIDEPEQSVYDELYCPRGDMENRIKEQMQLFSTRTSASRWWTNQFRLLLSALAYVLVDTLRRIGLKGTDLEKAHPSTIIIKLIKIGAIVIRNTRRLRIHFSSAFPLKNIFEKALRQLKPT